MTASLRRDYPKIQRAGAELVLMTPDTMEEHRQYTRALFSEDPPYLYVPDTDLRIAHRYSLIRSVEHPHGGFYYRSLWVINREGVIDYKSVPWRANLEVQEYQKLFAFLGSEPGEWLPTCGLGDSHEDHLLLSGSEGKRV